MAYAIRITFVDHEANAFVELGGTVLKTRREQSEEWGRIPAARDETDYILDKLGRNGIDLEDDKFVTRETVQVLTGKPVRFLIAEGRKTVEAEGRAQ